MLEVHGLSKSWPDFRLDVSMTLGDGRIAALLGPSGCGKSTLLRLMTGLLEPDAGTLVLDGRDLGGLGPDKRGIGMVFQDFALFPSMSVRRNIEYGPRMGGAGRAERARTAEELAASFEIGPLLDRNPSTLSGGEQQRVALARTLAAQPRLVLLDEPLSSLDANLRRRLRAEIAERLRAAGVMAIHVTHDVEEAFAVADRVFIMGNGRILEEGSPEELYARPRTAYGARFLGRGPVLPALGVEGPASAPRVATALGHFRCRAPYGSAAQRDLSEGRDSGRMALFFPSESPVVTGPSAGGDNLLTGTVIDSSFAGRFRRVRLVCEAKMGGRSERIELEIETAPSFHPSCGEGLILRVEAEDCALLPDSTNSASYN